MTDGDGLEVERIVNRLQSVDISDDRAQDGMGTQACEGIGRSRGSWCIYWGPGNEVNEDGNYVGSIFYPEPTCFGSTPGDFLVALSNALSESDDRFKFVGIEMNDALLLIETAFEASGFDSLSNSRYLHVNDGYVEFDNGKVTYRE
jgi:hypothetical protein